MNCEEEKGNSGTIKKMMYAYGGDVKLSELNIIEYNII